MTRGLNSGVYLMLLRFLHRDYAEAFRLGDSIATDTDFDKEGKEIFGCFIQAAQDAHPDAHAVRLKISLVTNDSGSKPPWDLTKECANHSLKSDYVSCYCRLEPQEELQILEFDSVVSSTDHPQYGVAAYTEYQVALCYNRKKLLQAQLNITRVVDTDDSLSTESVSVDCRCPPRKLLSNWPYSQDNTVFGENYAQITDISSVHDGEYSWSQQV
jgi:hypothetical protein